MCMLFNMSILVWYKMQTEYPGAKRLGWGFRFRLAKFPTVFFLLAFSPLNLKKVDVAELFFSR